MKKEFSHSNLEDLWAPKFAYDGTHQYNLYSTRVRYNSLQYSSTVNILKIMDYYQCMYDVTKELKRTENVNPRS
jgi:hypothetical protein